MGTTLTGTTPQDTYDSLIKVTDNGPISGTAKFLSDGLGNDSVLALSTTAVGIGTNAPAQKLTVSRNDAGNVSALIENAFLNQGNLLQFNQNTTSGTVTAYIGHGGDSSGDLKFFNGGSERIAILKAGGLTFNGDTAAANALDDYEEGTWTMGLSFGGGDTGITYTFRTGNYTKIGRQVNVTGWVRLSSKGSSTGVARLTGLPFTNGAASEFYTSVTLGYIDNISFADIPNGYVQVGATTINLGQTTNAGTLSDLTNANFINNSTLMINATYFV